MFVLPKTHISSYYKKMKNVNIFKDILKAYFW